MSAAEPAGARAAISNLKADYFLHTDLQDWDALAALFTPNAETDFREASGTFDSRQLMHDSAVFAANNAKVLAGVATFHIGSMPRLDFEDEDNAACIWSMEDWLWIPAGGILPAGTMHGWGHYHDRYVRRAEGWRIAATRLSRVRVDFVPA